MIDTKVKMTEMVFKPSHNTPPHLFVEDWCYMLTGSTYHKQPLIQSDSRKKELADAIATASAIYHWNLIAWVILDNHYHLILKSPPKDVANLSKFVASYHKFTAQVWNKRENLIGRKVWWNYWDTCIRSEKDYLNRLRYVFWNPVKHGIAQHPDEYPYSNYSDFLELDWFHMEGTPVEVTDVPEF